MGETVFFRLLEAEDKATALSDAIVRHTISGIDECDALRQIFSTNPGTFRQVPGTPFAYWSVEQVRALFDTFSMVEGQGRTVKQGLATTNDFRFVRTWWERKPDAPMGRLRWFPFSKGGSHSPFYADMHLLVDWLKDGAQSWAIYQAHHQRVGGIIKNPSFYSRPGLTWPRRTQSGLALRAMPAGCIFADKGPTVFVTDDDPEQLLALLAVTNSASFRMLVDLQMAFGSFEVGVIQRTPIPPLDSTATSQLAALAKEIWSQKRSMDTAVETSHAFVRPALLQATGATLQRRASAWGEMESQAISLVEKNQARIDTEALHLYGVSKDAFGGSESADSTTPENGDEEDSDSDAACVPVDAKQHASALLSYAVGACFGRWDVRKEVVDSQPKLEPFDPLPVCSAGMLKGADGLPLELAPEGYPLNISANGILVDDTGHASDISAAVRRAFDVLFPHDSEARWQEAGELLGITRGKLKDWLRKEFFAFHLQQYSRSRRKAPIYWQLATPSARYSVWLYLPPLTRDTLFTVLDLVKSKLQHEERQFETLRRDAGPTPSASQRRELDAQESFVDELRTFRDEVARVAPLWNPHLDDGVLINFAPLWRLVPQHRAWQKECKSCWEKLADEEGEYDWSHLAMHLWPERVVPKCREDRSLAIAHGLEDVFWVEDEDGKWKPRTEPTTPIDNLVQERTSAAVRTARDSLLSADTPVTAPRRTSTPRTRKARSS